MSPQEKAFDLPDLSDEQSAVYQAIIASSESVHYVNGVTGSGKTYLYIACAMHWIQQGGQVLMLVPEIGLTPQLHKKLQAFFPASQMAMLHSGLSDQQRAHVWQECALGAIRLLIGTRSALFAPLPKLTAIIIDEEHDLSYKQLSQIRYSARGAAFMRARSHGCKLVLGSATPSLACLRLISDNRLIQHRLCSRYSEVDLPRVQLVSVQEKSFRLVFSAVTIRHRTNHSCG